MSQENVEVVRRALAEFEQTQRPAEGLIALDFVWDVEAFPGWPGPAEYQGVDGFMEWFGEWTDAYAEWTFDFDVIAADEAHVVLDFVQRGRPRDTASWVTQKSGIVYTVEEGLITRGDVYASGDAALEAVGLSE
jgi:ketosteroid isomerase-like protein